MPSDLTPAPPAPVTAEELRAWKRIWEREPEWQNSHASLRLIAEVERLRAENERLQQWGREVRSALL